jgi:hypothetical protein
MFPCHPALLIVFEMPLESGLPPRYEIRPLGPEHAAWVKAIVSHCNVFVSPLWPFIMPEDKTRRCYELLQTGDYLVNHQIVSGLSLGIFDTEYEFQRPESAATGGKLLWDFEDETADMGQLVQQMDFPLVSVAMSYDGFNRLDYDKLAAMVAVLPAYPVVHRVLAERDPREPTSWEPTGPGQVVLRNATATKVGQEGHGLMKLMAHYLMRKSAAEGFRGIQIECFHDAVTHVWSNPPEPFKGEIVSKFNTYNYEHKYESGEVAYIFRPAALDLTKVYVTLKG